MSLPFLKPRNKSFGLIVQERAPDGSHENKPDDHKDQALITCGEDLIRAVNAKDAQSVADVFRAAFDILDSEPHEEGEHIESSDESETE